MPLCTLTTNVEGCHISCDFDSQLSCLVAKVLQKPLEKIAVVMHPGVRMFQGGTQEPAAHLVIWSIGVFSTKEKNKEMGTLIYEFLAQNLPVPMQRIKLVFHDLPPEALVEHPTSGEDA